MKEGANAALWARVKERGEACAAALAPPSEVRIIRKKANRWEGLSVVCVPAPPALSGHACLNTGRVWGVWCNAMMGQQQHDNRGMTWILTPVVSLPCLMHATTTSRRRAGSLRSRCSGWTPTTSTRRGSSTARCDDREGKGGSGWAGHAPPNGPPFSRSVHDKLDRRNARTHTC